MKIREIERLRAVAILMVMVMHLGSVARLFPELLRTPISGVDLFFVISGYVVSLSLLKVLPPLEAETSFIDALDKSRQALRTFYARRFFRIIPAALGTMLLARLLVGVFPERFGSSREWWVEFLAFFGGIYNYLLPFHTKWHSGVYWSLAVEEHFYLILPMLFVAFRTTNRRLLACVGLAMVSVLARALLPKPDATGIDLAYYEMFSSHLRFDSLMAGVVLALVSGRPIGRPIMPPPLMRWVVLPAIIAIIAALPHAADDYVKGREGLVAVWMLSSVLVGYAALDRGYVLSVPVLDRVLEYLGSRSYALYLTHLRVAWLEQSERPFWPGYADAVPMSGEHPWRHALVVFAACLVTAELVHRAIELPFMQLGRRLIEGKPGITPRTARLAAAAIVVVGLLWYRHALLIGLGPRNLARGTAVYASSREGDTGLAALTNGELETTDVPRTKAEDRPWMMLDLGSRHVIGTIRVYNRDDGHPADTIPLVVEYSDDAVHFQHVATRELPFSLEAPWRIRCTDVAGRYLRFRLTRSASLGLSEVEVFESAAIATIP